MVTVAALARGRQAGTGLIEVMVALLCSSLLAAGVLALVGDTAWLCRQQRAGIEARQQALVGADIVARELAAAGDRLEGARAVDWRGEVVPVIEPRADGLAVIVGVGPAVEVEVDVEVDVEVQPSGAGAAGGARRTYRAATTRPPGASRDRVGLEVDGRVVGVGVVDAEGLPASVLPAGTVREVAIQAGRGRVVIDWDRAPPGPVRALVPVRRRELGLRPDAGAGLDGMWQLRRRDDDGRWQPMVDAIAELVIRMPGAQGARAEITVRSRVPSGATGVTRRRVLLRAPS